MRESYDMAVKLTLGLEGMGSRAVDVGDGCGLTKYGICEKWNPGVDVRNLTIAQAKQIYLKKYWIPAGCDDQPFPMDICLFDSQVNPQNDPKLPGGGNQEILNLHPRNWQEYNIFRMQRYMRCSKPQFAKGHIFRVLNLCDAIVKLGG
ncbi:MAG: hypothetical protein KBA28_06330 [Syntrophaceae bacterium]|jgi:hypothetical protein|nr:hypothetical protein [Syntrophaceae bacterium]